MQEAGGRISFSIELPEDISKYKVLPVGKLVITFAANIGKI